MEDTVKPYYQDELVTLYHGDCRDVLPTLAEASIEACVTDPPYGLEFMGKEWDKLGAVAAPFRESLTDDGRVDYHGKGNAPFGGGGQRVRYGSSAASAQGWHKQWASEVFRVLKPGAHLLAFGGPRTHHRLISGIEDAGFEIRDCLCWLFGSGFPKSLQPYRSIMGDLCQSHERAPHAVAISPLSRLDWPEARTPIALGLALIQPEGVPALRIQIGAADDSSGALTVISPSAYQMAATTLNIGSSWLDSWDVTSEQMSTFITETVSRMTTDQRILRFCGSIVTRDFTIQGESRPSGCKCGVAAVVECSIDGEPSTSVTPMLIAPALATEKLNALKPLGSALKPAFEPIVLARKPFRGTLTDNVIRYGTGAINVDGCRIEGEWTGSGTRQAQEFGAGKFHAANGQPRSELQQEQNALGRWPANVCLDESAATMLDDIAGERPTGKGSGVSWGHSAGAHEGWRRPAHAGYQPKPDAGYGDTGGASRFFYVAKPSRAEREQGCDGLEAKQRDDSRKEGNVGGDNPRNRGLQRRGNHHPTVKPVELMRWLVRLVTPPGGTVIDPFMGSGSTGMACRYEGVQFIGIEREAEYVEIAERRIASCLPLLSAEQPA